MPPSPGIAGPMGVALLAACLAPFGADRHDLVGFRVAAIGWRTGDAGNLRPQVAFVVDDHPWVESPLDLRWYAVADAAAAVEVAESSIEPLAWGPSPYLPTPAAGLRFALVASHGDAKEIALVDPPVSTAMAPVLSVERTEMTIEDLDDVSIDARTSWVAVPTDNYRPGDVLRISSDLPARFMATTGTFMELSATVADWAAGALVFDDGELESAAATDDPHVTFVVLATGDTPTWAVRDVLQEGASTTLRVAGRVLPLPFDEPPTTAWVRLIADDASPSGLAAEVVDPDPDLSGADPYGTTALPCEVAVSGPFDPTWLLDGRCARDAVVDHVVVVVADP